MKKLITIGAIALVTTFTAWALWSTWVFNGQTFTTSETGGQDTSGLINVKGYEIIELTASVTGSDSVKLVTYVDGYFNGKYDLNVYNDSLIIDNGTGDYTEGYLLRGYGTNNIKGYEVLRFRVAVSSGAADDSSSALSYSLRVTGK